MDQSQLSKTRNAIRSCAELADGRAFATLKADHEAAEKVAVITGGNCGIGLATAQEFAANGGLTQLVNPM